MTIEALDSRRLKDFTDYCRAHRGEVDDSYLYDEHLAGFVPDGDNPACIALDDAGQVVGAASLIMGDYMRRGNRARFRIFHSEGGDIECYKGMLEALLPHAAGLGHLFIYAQELNHGQRNALEALGFRPERYTFLLLHEDGEVPCAVLPEGYDIKPFAAGRDEQHWCTVRNAAFASLRGSETPMTPEMAAAQNTGGGLLSGGAMVLWHGQKPVGVVRAEEDEVDGRPVAEIGPLAILPEYQGRGLGRAMLRTALRFAQERGFGRAALCVNAENERATALYLNEGFIKVEMVVCYRYELIS